jgi:GR25 family glycosyltransferase involved in LPS biosynthesis
MMGVDGKTVDIKTDPRVATLTKRNILSKTRRSHEELDSAGGVGCALSHIAVWQWMVDTNQPVCLIFEDDAVIPPNFIELVNRTIESSMLSDPTQWGIWLLGGKWDDLHAIPGQPVVQIDAFVLFHAYVITLDTAKRLVENVYPIHAHIDMWVSIYSYMNQIRIVGVPQLKLHQYQAAKTDIQSKEGCAICNVPTKFTTDYAMIPILDLYVARASELALIALVAYLMYKKS